MLIPPSDVKEKLLKDANNPKEVKDTATGVNNSFLVIYNSLICTLIFLGNKLSSYSYINEVYRKNLFLNICWIKSL